LNRPTNIRFLFTIRGWKIQGQAGYLFDYYHHFKTWMQAAQLFKKKNVIAKRCLDGFTGDFFSS